MKKIVNYANKKIDYAQPYRVALEKLKPPRMPRPTVPVLPTICGQIFSPNHYRDTNSTTFDNYS